MKNFIVACLAVLISFGFCEGASFDIAFTETIKHEGIAFTAFKYDNDGGGTKYGFTLKKFREICSGGKKYYFEPCDNDGDGRITKNDLRILSMQEVRQLYKIHYWDYLKCDQINSQLVADIAYDYLVNGGLSIKKLQKMVGAKVDGKIGTETLRKINQANECLLAKKLINSRGDWLFINCKKYIPHTYRVCKGGWANRLNYYILQSNLICYHEKIKIHYFGNYDTRSKFERDELLRRKSGVAVSFLSGYNSYAIVSESSQTSRQLDSSQLELYSRLFSSVRETNGGEEVIGQRLRTLEGERSSAIGNTESSYIGKGYETVEFQSRAYKERH